MNLALAEGQWNRLIIGEGNKAGVAEMETAKQRRQAQRQAA